MRTHHAERRAGPSLAAAELEAGGMAPPSGVDTVDENLSQLDEVPMPAFLEYGL
jgi:hypothetical protein